ncbi:MAG: STAS domain-containing protein [Acidimicrobiales bacterium]
MSAPFRTEPTPIHQGRPVHPSLLAPTRPTLVEIGEEPPVGTERRLPGGAALLERRPTAVVAELALVGEVDAFDRGAVIDACTAVGLEGARHLRIDGSELAFVDLRILEALAKVALHFHRHGGSFELTGLREPFASMWADIDPDAAVPAATPQGRLDDRVVALRGPDLAAASRGSAAPAPPQTPMPALRVVPDLGADREDSRSCPA